jgi:hypothetical protein
MRSGSESLTWFTMANYIFYVFDCHKPIKSCAESFGCDCSTAFLVATDSCMDLLQYDLAFLRWNSSLQDTRDAPFVEFTFYNHKGFGSPSDSSSFDYIFG